MYWYVEATLCDDVGTRHASGWKRLMLAANRSLEPGEGGDSTDELWRDW